MLTGPGHRYYKSANQNRRNGDIKVCRKSEHDQRKRQNQNVKQDNTGKAFDISALGQPEASQNSTNTNRLHQHTKGFRASLEDGFNDPGKQIDIGPAADTNDKQEDNHLPKSGMRKCVAEPCPDFCRDALEGGF